MDETMLLFLTFWGLTLGFSALVHRLSPNESAVKMAFVGLGGCAVSGLMAIAYDPVESFMANPIIDIVSGLIATGLWIKYRKGWMFGVMTVFLCMSLMDALVFLGPFVLSHNEQISLQDGYARIMNVLNVALMLLIDWPGGVRVWIWARHHLFFGSSQNRFAGRQ